MLTDLWTRPDAAAAAIAAIASAVSAVVAGGSMWIAVRAFRTEQAPVVTVGEWVGLNNGDARVLSIRNAGRGVAFNAAIQTDTLVHVLPMAWIGDLAAGESRKLTNPIVIEFIQAKPNRLFYQDVGRRWHSTRIVKHGQGIGTVLEGPRRWWDVPEDLRMKARAEAVGEKYARLTKGHFLQRWLKRSGR